MKKNKSTKVTIPIPCDPHWNNVWLHQEGGMAKVMAEGWHLQPWKGIALMQKYQSAFRHFNSIAFELQDVIWCQTELWGGVALKALLMSQVEKSKKKIRFQSKHQPNKLSLVVG